MPIVVTIITVIVVGSLVGILASKIIRDSEFSVGWCIAIGIVGAFWSSFAFMQKDITLGSMLSRIGFSIFGAVCVLVGGWIGIKLRRRIKKAANKEENADEVKPE